MSAAFVALLFAGTDTLNCAMLMCFFSAAQIGISIKS